MDIDNPAQPPAQAQQQQAEQQGQQHAQPPQAAGADQRIPVTLLTGFLGAGKTTLLNHLLKHPGMAGVAVLINEFGEIGVDHHLVEKVDESLMILDSGCICCSVQGDLVQALRNLAERSSRRQIAPVTRVLIETTGLADPVPVIDTLTQERFVAARYRCDGVITAVDATLALQQLDSHREAVRQVAVADRLLITKCDLADGSGRAALDARLAALNPAAARIEVRKGRVDPDALFGCGLYTAAGKLPDVAAWLGEERLRAPRPAPPDPASLDGALPGAPSLYRASPDRAPLGLAPPGPVRAAWRGKAAPAPHVAPVARHDDSVASFVVGFAQPVPWHGFAVVMGTILRRYGGAILRVKGLMNVAGDPLPRVIQCVQDVAYPPLSLPAWPAGSAFADRRGRLVFIVRDLGPAERQAIHDLLGALPRDAVKARAAIGAAPLPTRCWLSHQAGAASAGALDHMGWVIHTKRFKNTL